MQSTHPLRRQSRNCPHWLPGWADERVATVWGQVTEVDERQAWQRVLVQARSALTQFPQV
jgi:hypothetical protein